MRRKIPYYATRDAIFHAGDATDFFDYGPYTKPAALCAEMARLAYVKEEAACRGFLAKLDFELLYFVPTDDGTQGFIARKGDVVIIAFRGTEPDDRRDILTDLDLPRIRWPEGGAVHSGFADALDESWPEFEGHLPPDQGTPLRNRPQPGCRARYPRGQPFEGRLLRIVHVRSATRGQQSRRQDHRRGAVPALRELSGPGDSNPP